MTEQSATNTSLFADALSYMEKAAKYADYAPKTLERLRHHERVIEVSIPVVMDDGTFQVFRGFRAQHNTFRGPAKGGIRFHPAVNIDELHALSFWMTSKCAATSLPFGGGKGGIICNPKQMSQGELERLSRGYIRKLAEFIGPDIDIPAPDVYTNPTIMGWMMDEYSVIHRKKTPGVITGKPIDKGGSLGRNTATGRGAYFCIKLSEKHCGWHAPNETVAIQGFGNAAQSLATSLFADGYKIVAVSDSKGGIYKKEGFDIPRLIAFKNSGRSVTEYVDELKDVELISNEDLLAMETTLLVPAALESVITEANVDNVRAKAVIELANGPTSCSADKVLCEKDIFVVPDILANAGGVIVSYFEWVQNRQGFYWTEEEVNNRLRDKMKHEFNAIYTLKQDKQIDMRTATYAHALQRLDAAMT